MRRSRFLAIAGCVALLTGLLLAPVPAGAAGHVFSTGPSAFCHVTDGAFTDCDPGGGIEEWSDISSLSGLGTSAGAVVYTDQSVSPPRLLLMYDLLGNAVPLAPDSFFDITFDISEGGVLEEYRVLCFGDNTFQVFEDGEDITAEADTVDCAVGFNGANVQVELEIDTLVTYSPDIPLFWSTFAPPGGDRPCPPEDPACEQPPRPTSANDNVQTSATIVIANSDGTTQVLGLPVGGSGADLAAALCDRTTGTGLLVELMLTNTARNHGSLVSQGTRDSRAALASLVHNGLITAKQAKAIHSCIMRVLSSRDVLAVIR